MRSVATEFCECEGTMMSACRDEGRTKVSYEGLTKLDPKEFETDAEEMRNQVESASMCKV